MTLRPEDLLHAGSAEIARQGVRTGPRCTARSKKRMATYPDKPELHRCGNIAEPGRRVCRYHGGASPVKHGRYSQQLVSLREHYISALKDDSMLDLREPLAVLDAVAKRCIERAEERDTPEFRRRVLAHLDAAREAIANGDPVAGAAAMTQAHALAREGVAEDAALRDMRDSIGEFSDRVHAAWRVRLAQANAMNFRDLVSTLARFVEIVSQECGGELAIRVATRVQAEITGDLMMRETRDTEQYEGVEALPEHEGVDVEAPPA